MSATVCLFDIDGVLVEPHGYREATRAVMDHFTGKMGIGSRFPGDAVMDAFESYNITSEWDITALCLAGLLEAALTLRPDLDLPGDLSEACSLIGELGLALPPVESSWIAARLGAADRPGCTFSEFGLRLSLPGSPDPLFPRLARHPLARTLLAESRDVRRSPVTRLFQQYALGTEEFTSTYGLPAEIQTAAFLRQYDRPLLAPEISQALLERWRGGQLRLAAYTARPSRLRCGESPRDLPYSPEAEMVLELAGLEAIPLVGYGQVCQLAALTGLAEDQVIKPAVIHALGAVGAAVTGDEQAAMRSAADWVRDPRRPGIFAALPALEINVFEDSAGSIRAVHKAAGMLTEIGVPTSVSAFGISTSPVKLAALEAAGAEICPDVNTAIGRAAVL